MLTESRGISQSCAISRRAAPFRPNRRPLPIRRCLVPAALLAMSLSSPDSHAADPEIKATYVDVLTSYSWGYKSGAKQPFGSYKNGRSVHAISRRVGSSGTDGSPDQLAWVDEHTGQVFALEGTVGYPDVGI